MQKLPIILAGARQNPEILVLLILAMVCHAALLQFPTWQASLGFLKHGLFSLAIMLAGATGPALPPPATKDPQPPENPS